MYVKGLRLARVVFDVRGIKGFVMIALLPFYFVPYLDYGVH